MHSVQWKILTRGPRVNIEAPCLPVVQTLCYTFITTNLPGTENTWASTPVSTESTQVLGVF